MLKPAPRRLAVPEETLAAVAFLIIAAALNPFRELALQDDWAYAWSVRRLLETGSFRVSDWASPTLAAQAYWGALFCARGFSFAALRVSTLVLAAVAVAAFHRVLLAGGVERRSARLATAALALQPLFLSLSLTFMTDVPFLALALVAAALLQRRRTLASGLALAAACLIRQTGLLVALGLAGFLGSGGELDLHAGLSLVLPSVLALAAYLGWYLGVHGETWAHRAYDLRWTAAHLLNLPRLALDGVLRAGWTGLYAGLAALPFASPRAAREGIRRPWMKALVALGALMALAAFPPPDAILSKLGIGGVFCFGRGAKAGGFLAWPGFWPLLGLGATFALASLGAARMSPAARLMTWAFAPLGCAILAGGYFNDRYLLAVVPPALALAAGLPKTRARGVVLAGVAALAAAGALDDLNWNEAFWSACRRLESRGVPAERVGGTLEYVAWNNYQPRMDALKREKPLLQIDDGDWLRGFQETQAALVTFAADAPETLFLPAGQTSYFSPLAMRRVPVYSYLSKPAPHTFPLP